MDAFGITNIGSYKENQDVFFIREGHYGILDGHGTGGKMMATEAAAILETGGSFADADSVVSNLGFNGGTTASVLSITEAGCTVSHVGDSEVRYYDGPGAGVSLTVDHSAASKEEFLRIQKTPMPAACIYMSRMGGPFNRPIFVSDGSGDWIVNPAGGEYRNTVRGDWSTYLAAPYNREFLAVTRALGDVTMKPYGVIAEPNVMTVGPPEPGVTRAIVMGSDGLWDTIQYEEVGAIVMRPDLVGHAEAAAKELMNTSLALTMKHFKKGGDNVTIVVVYITADFASDVTKSTEDTQPDLPSPLTQD